MAKMKLEFKPYEISGNVLLQYLTPYYSKLVDEWVYNFSIASARSNLKEFITLHLETLTEDMVYTSDIFLLIPQHHKKYYDGSQIWGFSVEFGYKTEEEKDLDRLIYFIERL